MLQLMKAYSTTLRCSPLIIRSLQDCLSSFASKASTLHSAGIKHHEQQQQEAEAEAVGDGAAATQRRLSGSQTSSSFPSDGEDGNYASTSSIRTATSGSSGSVASSSSSSSSRGSYVDRLVAGISGGHRLAVSRGITLCESSRPEHAEQAAELLMRLEALRSGNGVRSFRVGVSGPPGAGKSCLLETLGCLMLQAGNQVAVLAIDPSSEQTGGAILGDKLRMVKLGASPDAYVRPSPARGSLGGVARTTSDAIFVCEAAGYDKVLVETVGVGQSETLFSDLVDCSVLVLPPVGGDEWQAMKKGILEVVDIIAVNKADGPTLHPAMTTVSQYTGAMSFAGRRHRHWAPRVLPVSAKTGYNVGELRDVIQEFEDSLRYGDELARMRQQQRRRLFWVAAEELLHDSFRHSPRVADLAASLLPGVQAGEVSPRAAAHVAVAEFLSAAAAATTSASSATSEAASAAGPAAAGPADEASAASAAAVPVAAVPADGMLAGVQQQQLGKEGKQ